MWVQKKRRSTVPSTASWEIREPLQEPAEDEHDSSPLTQPEGGAAPVVQGGQDRQLAGQVQHPAQQQPEKQDQGKGDQEEEHPGQLQGQIIRHRRAAEVVTSITPSWMASWMGWIKCWYRLEA